MSWKGIVEGAVKIFGGVGEITPLERLQEELRKLLNGQAHENPGVAAKDAFALILTHNNQERGWRQSPSMRWVPQSFIEKVPLDRLSSTQVLFLLALSAVPRKSGLDWRASLRLLDIIADDMQGAFAALESFCEGGAGPTADSLASALTSLFDRASQTRQSFDGLTFEQPAWIGASPLLAASIWQKVSSNPSLPTLRRNVRGSEAAKSYIKHIPGASLLCDAAMGLCAAPRARSLQVLLTTAAPTVEALVELLLHFAVEEGSTVPEVPKRFAELLCGEPVWKLLGAWDHVEKLSESLRERLATPWGSELLVALRALRHADSLAIFEVDTKKLVGCIAVVPLPPLACEGLLSEAAELALVLPDLLPCMLLEDNASTQLVPLISVVSAQAARKSARKWLGLIGRRGAPALFAALQQFYQLAAPSANSLVDLPAALYEEARVVSRALGLPSIMAALRNLRVDPGTRIYSAALRLVRELVADLATTSAAREAMQELVPEGQLDTELADEAGAAVLDLFIGRVSLEEAVGAGVTLRTALLHSAGRFWTLVVGIRGLHGARVQEHGVRKTVVENVRSFGTSLQVGSLTVAAFRAVTDDECRPNLLLLLQLSINRDLSAEVVAAEEMIRKTEEDLASVAWMLEQCGAACDCTAERAKHATIQTTLPQCALGILGSPAFWGILGCVLPAATSLRPLRGCALFAAVWATQLEAAHMRIEPGAAEEALPVPPDMAQQQHQPPRTLELSDILESVVPATSGQIQVLGLSAEVTCGDLDAVRYRIAEDAADDEARSVAAFIIAALRPDFTSTLARRLRAFSRREQAVKTAAQMKLFLQAYGVAGGTLQARLHEAAVAAMDKDSKCDALHQALEASSEVLVASGFHAILDIVRVLGTTKGIELLDFLRNAADDLRALINSVEERGGGQLRAETVGDVIKVRSALAALLDLETVSRLHPYPLDEDEDDDRPTALDADDAHLLANEEEQQRIAAKQASILEALRPVAQMQGILLRIEACCAHVNALKRLHSSLGNRQGLLRFTVGDIVKRGRYMFSSSAADSRCQIHVSVGETVLDEVQLRDMNDSMRLQQHNKRLEAESAGVEETEEMGGGDVEGEHHEGEGATNAEIDRFLAWGDHAQAIVDSVSELRLLGCIDYRDYDIVSLPGSELERKAEEEMQAAVDFRAILAAQRSACVYLTFYNGPQLWQLSDALLNRESADGADELAALALLRYVHPDAELPVVRFPQDGEWLVRLSNALVSVFDAVRLQDQDQDEVSEALSPRAHALVQPGSVSVISCASGAMVRALVGLFASAFSLPPRRCQLLVCNVDTSDEEVATFLLRVVMAPQEHLFRHYPFIICHVERLSMAVHLSLTARLLQLQSTLAGGGWRLAVLCDGSQRQPLLDDFRGRVIEDCARCAWWPVLPIPGRLLFEPGRRVTVVTSDRPGLGKSTYITNRVGFHAVKHLLLAGSVSSDDVVARLDELALQQGDSLCLQLRQGRDHATTEGLLYELTQLRCVMGTTAVALLPSDVHIFVEVANPSVGTVDALLAQLPLLSAFDRVDRVFNLGDITIIADNDDERVDPRSWLSDCQVVCLHLALLEAGAADARGVCGIIDNDRCEWLEGRQQEAAPLPPGDCHRLLHRYFFEGQNEPSYAALAVFLRVLAAQLRRFVGLPMSMLLEEGQRQGQGQGQGQGSRTCILVALVAMARDFATQSVHAAREMQTSNLQRLTSAELEVAASVERMSAIINWEATDSTLLTLDEDGCVVCLRIAQEHEAIRATIAQVVQAMSQWGSRDDALVDVTKAGPEVLFERLGRIVGQHGWPVGELTPGYVLTADNLLKMAMIYTRVSCGVPVIIMGETGCGKTSLIRNLSKAMGLSDLQFRVLNFHAGLSSDDVADFVMACEQCAQEMQEVFPGRKIHVVAFLDEVNTCAHLALLTELICDSRLHGRSVLPGVAFVAAVNPYRLREKMLDGVGLQHANAIIDPLSRLVYRVHPLPETMLGNVWDFGRLTAEDECRYLRAMMEAQDDVRKSPIMQAPLHVELATICLAASQGFMSQHESDCSSVSLRDPHRFKRLVVWFKAKLTEREEIAREAARLHRPGGGNTYSWLANAAQDISVGLGFTTATAPAGEVYSDSDIELRAIVLALAHCYRARLATSQSRLAYTVCLASTIRGFATGNKVAWKALHKDNYRQMLPEDVEEIVRSEQRDYLDRMTLPPGTAMNEALRENVFTLLVCILNRLPIFLVGKPGCSKSLAMKLIEQHLRGPDSADPFFRKLPQVYVIGFQGSFDSTSEGVLRVFNKAREYAESNPVTEVVTVVLLDEVGLAEISPNNPLKVLHSLLETPDGSPLPYAVVGISNWALDAAKINRAILLSRPDPSLDDLHETAKEITRGLNGALLGEERLRVIAAAYNAFQAERSHDAATKNFHGLRDFYSLCKCLARLEDVSDERVVSVIYRCFGGSPGSAAMFVRQVRNAGGRNDEEGEEKEAPPERVTGLVRANLVDPIARNLLLITRGDAALGVLHASFPVHLRPPVIMIGSSFKDDQRPSYTYDVLSKIVLFMETGQSICLYKHSRVYGSLYDMLNQSYSLVDDRRFCRIALGASDTLCNIHPDFRCIVVEDEEEVVSLDPPFLNRFEKHRINCVDALSRRTLALLPHLTDWVLAASTIYTSVDGDRLLDFDVADAFSGFGLRRGIAVGNEALREALAALLLRLERSSGGGALPDEDLLCQAKERLLATSSADAVLRLSHSALCRYGGGTEVQDMQRKYFEARRHTCLMSAIDDCLRSPTHPSAAMTGAGLAAEPPRLMVLTHSAFSAVPRCFEESQGVLVLKLGSFTCEAKLSSAIAAFWYRPGHHTLVMQASASIDSAHIALCKHLMEFHEREHRGAAASRSPPPSRSSSNSPRDLPSSDKVCEFCKQTKTTHSKDCSQNPAKRQVIVLHLWRRTAGSAGTAAEPSHWHFGGLSDWQQVAVDSVDGTEADAKLLRDTIVERWSLAEWIEAGAGDQGTAEESLLALAMSELPWIFRQIRYNGTDGAKVASHTVASHTIEACRRLCSAVGQNVLKELCAQALGAIRIGGASARSADWLCTLACNRLALLTDAIMATAMRRHARHRVREPLLRMIHMLEKFCGLSSLRQGPMLRMWHQVHMQPDMLRNAARATGAPTQPVPRPMDLHFPLSPLLRKAILKLREVYVDEEGGWRPRAEAAMPTTRTLAAQLLVALEAVAEQLPVGGKYLRDTLLQCAAEVGAAEHEVEEADRDDGGSVKDDGGSVKGRGEDLQNAFGVADDDYFEQQTEEKDDSPLVQPELTASTASDSLGLLLSTHSDLYVLDVLQAEACALAGRFSHLDLPVPRLVELLRRALPGVLPHPLTVHAQLWRVHRALEVIVELEEVAGDVVVEEVNAGLNLAGGSGAGLARRGDWGQQQGPCDVSLMRFGFDRLSAACTQLSALLGQLEPEAVAAWISTAQRVKLLGSRLQRELGRSDEGVERPPPQDLQRLRMLVDVASSLFASLGEERAVACLAVRELARCEVDHCEFLSRTIEVLGGVKQQRSTSPSLARRLDSCLASLLLRLLEQQGRAPAALFRVVVCAAMGATWTWGPGPGFEGGGDVDAAAGPPLLGRIFTCVLFHVVHPADDILPLIEGRCEVPREMEDLVAASLSPDGNGTAPARLLCDAVQRDAASWLVEPKEHGGGTEAEAAVRFRQAARLVLGDGDKSSAGAVQLVAAIGYAKAYLANAAGALAPEGACAGVLTEALRFLPGSDRGAADDASPARALKVYLLRELVFAGGLSTQDLAHAAGVDTGRFAQLLPFLFSLPWPGLGATRLGFSPFSHLRPGFNALRDGLAHLMRTREGPAPQELEAVPASPDILIAVARLALLAEPPPAPAAADALETWCVQKLGDHSPLGRLAARACRVGRPGGVGPHLPLPCALPADCAILNSALMFLLACCPPASPLMQYILGETRENEFFIASRSRGPYFQNILLALADPNNTRGLTRYQCNCGFVFPVMNCGHTTESGTCPVCRGAVGNAPGGGYNQAVSRRLDPEDRPIMNQAELERLYPELPGYSPLYGRDDGREGPQLGISPVVFRLMHLIVHLAHTLADLDGCLALGPNLPPGGAWGAVVSSWEVLLELLPGCSRDALGMLLHRIIIECLPTHSNERLQTATSRAAWEHRFASNVAPLLANVPAACAECAALFAEGTEPGVLEQQIAEHGAGYAASYRPKLLRCIAPPSFRELEHQLAAAGAEAHPLLHYATTAAGQSKLRQAALLPRLLRFSRMAFDALDHRLSRAQLTRDVASLLTSELNTTEALQAYVDFTQAWAELIASVEEARFQCKEVRFLPLSGGEGGEGVFLDFFCLASDGAGMLSVALCYLGTVQNIVVGDVAEIAPRCAALQFRCNNNNEDDGAATARTVRLFDLQASDTLAFSAENFEALAALSRPSLATGAGAGRTTVYDLDACEADLAFLLGSLAKAATDAAGAVEPPPALRFPGEALQGNVYMFGELRRNVPQDEKMPGAVALADALGDAASSSGSSAQVFSLLSALESLCFYISKAGGRPEDELRRFAESWLPTEELEALVIVPSLRVLRLEHFEALFIVVEDAVAGELLTDSTIDPAFAEALPEPLVAELRALCRVPGPKEESISAKAAEAEARAGALADALKRFARRFLTGESSFSKQQASEPLNLNVYQDLLYWRPATAHLAPEMLPEGLLLSHVYRAWIAVRALAADMSALAQARAVMAAACGTAALARLTGASDGPAGGSGAAAAVVSGDRKAAAQGGGPQQRRRPGPRLN